MEKFFKNDENLNQNRQIQGSNKDYGGYKDRGTGYGHGGHNQDRNIGPSTIYSNLMKATFKIPIHCYLMTTQRLIIEDEIKSSENNLFDRNLIGMFNKSLNDDFKVFSIIDKYLFSPNKLNGEITEYEVEKQEKRQVKYPSKSTSKDRSEESPFSDQSSGSEIKYEQIKIKYILSIKYQNTIDTVNKHYKKTLLDKLIKQALTSMKGIIKIGRKDIFNFTSEIKGTEITIGKGIFFIKKLLEN